MEEFKYLGTNLNNQYSIQEEIKSRLKSGNACYHSVQNLLSCSLLSKNLKIKVYMTIILPIELDWSIYTCLTQLYDDRNIYIIYYIKNTYTFRPSLLAIFRLINKKKRSKQLYSTCVYCIQRGGVR